MAFADKAGARGIDYSIDLWDATSGTLLRSLPGHHAAISGTAWSPDGKRLASSAYDGTVRFWNPDTGQPLGLLLSLRDSQVLAITPAGHYRGSPQAQRELVYVALTDDGQQLTLAPQQFAEKYGWQNEPEKVRLVD